MHNFEQVNWSAPLDLDAIYAGIEPESRVRGALFDSALKLAKEKTSRPIGQGSYSKLRQYPTKELAEVLVECAQLIYPDHPLRMALRLLGQQVFANLVEIPATTFLFSVAGRDVKKVFGLIQRAYALFSSGAKTALREEEDGAMLVIMRKHWLFADCYHYGIFEGALAYHKVQAALSVRRYSLCDIDVRIEFK